MNTEIDFPVSSIRICIDERKPFCKGKIYGVALEKELAFESRDQLIRQILLAYELIGKPQPNMVMRRFVNEKEYDPYNGNPKRYHDGAKIALYHGKLDTADLVMTTMKKAEWQGMWKNIDGTVRSHFCTMMECVMQI